MAKFLITTPIYYINGMPHIGHAYTTIAADAIARYHRAKGDDVTFLTGTDENAQKNVESALKNGKKGENRELIQKYVDEMSAKYQNTWDALEITNDDFIRTTEKRHADYVEKFWNKVSKSGDIYKSTYEGLYCTGCESYKTESELVDGKCPDHKRIPETLSEENYFFRLSKYKKSLLDHIKKNPDFIQPESRRNEVIAYIKDHADDFSISRKSLGWGIPVPGDKSQTIYVWFDALLNYISFNVNKWPAQLHLVGKDIIKFHCAYWPAMLMSAGMPLPKTIFAHGFFTINGEKMSKTLGNVIDPVEMAKEYGNDALRYYLLREIPFGSDGDFSIERFKERYTSELANGIGNLTFRILSMIEKYSDSKMPSVSKENKLIKGMWKEYEGYMNHFELDKALDVVIHHVAKLDAYIVKEKPWAMDKAGDKRIFDVLYILTESLRNIAWAFMPFIPNASIKIFEQLGVGKTELKKSLKNAQKWGGLEKGTKTKKDEALFPRLEK